MYSMETGRRGSGMQARDRQPVAGSKMKKAGGTSRQTEAIHAMNGCTWTVGTGLMRKAMPLRAGS